MKHRVSVTAGSAHPGHGVAFMVVAIFLLFILVLLPFAISSVFANVVTPQSHSVFPLLPNGTAASSATYMNLDVVGVNEWTGLASIRVSGQHVCTGCDWDDSILLLSIPDAYARGEGLPPAQELLFPAARSKPLNQTVQLPVYGEPVRYPFDDYHLTLGVLILHLKTDGATLPMTADQAQLSGQQLFASLRMQAPRMLVSPPKAVPPAQLTASANALPYTLVVSMTFSRPHYLQVLAVLLVSLVTAAAAYAVFLRPLAELVINVGALVLGVWGIRAILLGSDIPGITAIDLALSVVILFLLVAITVRALLFLRTRIIRHV